MKFSDRVGITKPKEIIQIKDMDESLRNSLWNCFFEHFAKRIAYRTPTGYEGTQWTEFGRNLYSKIYKNFFYKPIDEIRNPEHEIQKLREAFLSKWKYYEVYNFCEFLAKSGGLNNYEASQFTNECNNILRINLSGWTFIGNNLSSISSEKEIKSIEETIAVKGSLKESANHYKKALELFSKKPNPDCENSIKESCSAVEALLQNITKKDSYTLGQCISEMRKNTTFDDEKLLLDALDKIWGFASQFGIRHANNPNKKSNIGFEEAKFCLVLASATINFFKEKNYKK